MSELESKLSFIKALNRVQSVLEDARRDAKNPHLKSKYATLGSVWDVIREPLAKNGFAITQVMEAQNTSWVLKTTLWHEAGHFVNSLTPILNNKGDAQGMGSALTYARRYALLGLIGVCPDDDDGEGSKQISGSKQSLGSNAQLMSSPPKPATAAKQVDWGDKLVSDKQVGLIQALLKKANISSEKFHYQMKERFSKTDIYQLSQKEASGIIEQLTSVLPI